MLRDQYIMVVENGKTIEWLCSECQQKQHLTAISNSLIQSPVGESTRLSHLSPASRPSQQVGKRRHEPSSSPAPRPIQQVGTRRRGPSPSQPQKAVMLLSSSLAPHPNKQVGKRRCGPSPLSSPAPRPNQQVGKRRREPSPSQSQKAVVLPSLSPTPRPSQ